MTTLTEYAALSAFVYNDQRGGGGGQATENILRLPTGWTNLTQLGFTTGTNLVNYNPFSFTAGAYLNTATGEIVIAYKGTDFLVEMSSRAFNTVADIVTDVGLALAKTELGVYNAQQLSASTYYLTVKEWAVANGYDPAKISFTGHSLGGGIAANMAAWFDMPATTFAAAPFEASTINPAAIITAAATLTLQAGLTASFAVLEEINKLRNLIVPGEYTRRESAVTNYYNQGEMLTYLRAVLPTTVGMDIPISIGSQPISSAVALHSMNLHAAFLFDGRLRDLATKLPELIPELLNTKLYAADPNSRTRDFITSLVSDQIRKGLTADSVLKHFSGDLLKLTQYSANLKEGALGKALIDIAIADYYFMQNGFSGKDFFAAIEGGIQFDLGDIGTGWSSNRATVRLDNATTQQLNLDLQTRLFLAQDNYWSIQSGTNALNATGTGSNNDAMIGGASSDILDGGAGNDFLYGGDGADTLTGGAGSDLLEGGAGYDTYYASAGDKILDSGGQGIVYFGAGQLDGGTSQDGGHTWQSADGAHRYTAVSGDIASTDGATLIVDGALTIEHFHNNDLGISLTAGQNPTTLQPPQTTNDIIGDPLIHTTTLVPGSEGADWVVIKTYDFLYDDQSHLISYSADYYLVDANRNPTEGGQQARDDTLLHDTARKTIGDRPRFSANLQYFSSNRLRINHATSRAPLHSRHPMAHYSARQ